MMAHQLRTHPMYHSSLERNDVRDIPIWIGYRVSFFFCKNVLDIAKPPQVKG